MHQALLPSIASGHEHGRTDVLTKNLITIWSYLTLSIAREEQQENHRNGMEMRGQVESLMLETHPYADEFPMASEDELAGLASSITAVGLSTPGVVARSVAGIEDGRLVDGRNRREACARAGVEFRFELRDFQSDDELKEFVIGINLTGRRESMSPQIAAASEALILGAGRRRNGRWIGWSNKELSKNLESSEREARRQCGLILDTLGRDKVREVRDEVTTLNAAYEAAQQKRREDEEAAARQAQEAAAEVESKAFIEANAPDLAVEVGGPVIRSYIEAYALWEKRNREEAAARREEEAMRAAARATELSAWGKACDGLLAALSYAASSRPPDDTDRYPAVEVFIERYRALGNHITTWKETP